MEAYLKTALISTVAITALVAATAFAAGEGPGAGTMMDSAMNKSTSARANHTLADEDTDHSARDTTRTPPAYDPAQAKDTRISPHAGSAPPRR